RNAVRPLDRSINCWIDPAVASVVTGDADRSIIVMMGGVRFAAGIVVLAGGCAERALYIPECQIDPSACSSPLTSADLAAPNGPVVLDLAVPPLPVDLAPVLDLGVP